MQLIIGVVTAIQASPFFRNISVRAYKDEPEEDEQVLVKSLPGYSAYGQAPIFTPQFTVHARARSHKRAEEIILMAYRALQRRIPESDEYLHSTPLTSSSPGYIDDDDQGRPTYGFTVRYASTPKVLLREG
jgi:hypothetical protein